MHLSYFRVDLLDKVLSAMAYSTEIRMYIYHFKWATDRLNSKLYWVSASTEIITNLKYHSKVPLMRAWHRLRLLCHAIGVGGTE